MHNDFNINFGLTGSLTFFYQNDRLIGWQVDWLMDFLSPWLTLTKATFSSTKESRAADRPGSSGTVLNSRLYPVCPGFIVFSFCFCPGIDDIKNKNKTKKRKTKGKKFSGDSLYYYVQIALFTVSKYGFEIRHTCIFKLVFGVGATSFWCIWILFERSRYLLIS